MELKEQARIIALARLAGATGSDKELLERYATLYQSAIKSLSETEEPAKVEVFKRPF